MKVEDRLAECVANARKVAPNANEGECIAALLVLILTPKTLAFLEEHDPMALRQARTALRLPDPEFCPEGIHGGES